MMSDLKRLFESIDLSRVETYIQSGNVLFESNEKEDMLREKIENKIEKNFGFSVVVVLRTAAELEKIVRDCAIGKQSINFIY